MACPLCADTDIQKMPSAPRLNFGGHHAPESDSNRADPATPSPTSGNLLLQGEKARIGQAEGTLPEIGLTAQAAFLTALRQVVAATEDMGPHFADEARRMHYGEVEARSIRGQASAREAVELLEEGIHVIPLPMLAAVKETLQ
ncbi:identified by similarity to GB:AAK22812.1; match to protein family HMM PF06676 [Polaromonas sp. CG9_12]|nr:identified by similarity to GB:AAK22812.1; match to protein family HMM PF06676 [Polaromonas sp. CG9_12]